MSDDNGNKDDTRSTLEAGGTAQERREGRWGNNMALPTEEVGDFRGAVRRLWQLLGRERPKLALVLVASVVSVALNAYGPRLLGEATDIIIDGAFFGDGIDFDALHDKLRFIVGLYLVSWALGYGVSYTLAGVIQRTMQHLRSEVEDKIHRLPLWYIDGQPRGDLLSRVTNDIDNLSQSLQQTINMILTSVLMLLFVTIVMFTISWELTLVALVTVPLSLFLMKQIAARARPKFMEQWGHTGAVNAHVEEVFTGHAVVKSFGRAAEMEETFAEHNDRLYEASFAAQFMSSLIQPMTLFMGNVQYLLIAVVGGLRISSGAISIGDMQAMIQYARQFSQPMAQLASMATVFQSGIASLERVIELLDAPEHVPEVDVDRNEPTTTGRVVFDDVTFGYGDTPLIEGLSLVAEPGQTVAIVGPTGAGKTTLVNLIMRFYELDGGRITLDGRDIASMPRAELRSRIGMVLQDTWLFGGTIRDNLAYGNPAANEDEIMAAADAAYVDRFVHHLPEGYDTVIADEGDSISAGEKQLLTIARAFLRNPAILILDEATSSVDTRTEVLIQEAMNTLRSQRTSFVIAHRLSTIRGADVILVMENGSIVEQGNHDELLARDGAYAALYRSQFSGAITDT